jgi:hypothetical protein
VYLRWAALVVHRSLFFLPAHPRIRWSGAAVGKAARVAWKLPLPSIQRLFAQSARSFALSCIADQRTMSELEAETKKGAVAETAPSLLSFQNPEGL